jgi:2-oxoglutarate dehydrogenase E1 component
LLRRQAKSLAVDPRPLIVMTPKSLLRHPKAVSHATELTTGTFQPVLDDVRSVINKHSITRIVMSSGKVIVDLLGSPALDTTTTALIRLEEIHPFPVSDIDRIVATYPNATEFVFVQEEPLNMGTATYVCPRLKEVLPTRLAFRVVSRPMEASPAEGSIDMHNAMQAHIVQSALS